jgi:Ca2+-binding RTX toxin-like protein
MTNIKTPLLARYLKGYSYGAKGSPFSSAPLKKGEEMRRTVFLLASMALAVVLASGAALAINTIQCPTGKWGLCEGTKHNDTIYGRASFNDMLGRGGNDILKAGDSGDLLNGNQGQDRLLGEGGRDFLELSLGDDKLNGGGGDDFYSKHLVGSWGHDTLTDARGIEKVYFGDGWTSADLTINLTAQAKPNVKNANRTGTIDWDGEVIENATGGEGNDTIIGNDAANVLDNDGQGDIDTFSGRGGNDEIWATGEDVVDCGKGDDTLFYFGRDIPQNVNCETVTR